jgi:hypothetical protein
LELELQHLPGGASLPRLSTAAAGAGPSPRKKRAITKVPKGDANSAAGEVAKPPAQPAVEAAAEPSTPLVNVTVEQMFTAVGMQVDVLRGLPPYMYAACLTAAGGLEQCKGVRLLGWRYLCRRAFAVLAAGGLLAGVEAVNSASVTHSTPTHVVMDVGCWRLMALQRCASDTRRHLSKWRTAQGTRRNWKQDATDDAPTQPACAVTIAPGSPVGHAP